MRLGIKLGIIAVVLGGVGVAAYPRARDYWRERNRPHFRQAKVVRGKIVSVVNATGTVQPVLRVQVGSFVSGPIEELYVDFNTKVKKDDLLARIDPRIYEASVARDKASLATCNAEVKRVNALLEQAKNDEKRAQALRATNEDYISDTVMDQYKYKRLSLEAELKVAEASVEQAQAALQNSQTNLGYTEIRSPVDGTIIDRKIDPGQTLAAQFNTPELFIVAPDMEKKMHIFASVDEADMGLIREAQRRKQPVHFTVDAYPDDLFEGTIDQVRMNPTTEQNVVTYPVVIEAHNPDLKLLPGMTANLSFQIDQHDDVLKIPNAALRFYPKLEHVRPEDRKLLDGAEVDTESEQEDNANIGRSAMEIAEAGKERSRRHVWIVEGDFLKAVEVTTGLSDSKYTEMVSKSLEDGQELVTGVKSGK